MRTPERHFRHRLRDAIRGFRAVASHGANFRIQLGCAGLTLVGIIVLHPPLTWWALVSFSVAGVLSAELANTALETALDRLHPEWHEAIGLAKDIAAASVLVFAAASVVIACLVLIERWEVLIGDWVWLRAWLSGLGK